MRFVATVFYTGMLAVLFDVALAFYEYGWCPATYGLLPKKIQATTFFLTGGISFSVVKAVLIDCDTNKLVSRFSVGPFSRDRRTEVPELEYVAVFLDAKEYYQVNLWYKGNKHYKMYAFSEKLPAFQLAEQVAKKLTIDLLDATEKGNSRWIEKTRSETAS